MRDCGDDRSSRCNVSLLGGDLEAYVSPAADGVGKKPWIVAPITVKGYFPAGLAAAL